MDINTDYFYRLGCFSIVNPLLISCIFPELNLKIYGSSNIFNKGLERRISLLLLFNTVLSKEKMQNPDILALKNFLFPRHPNIHLQYQQKDIKITRPIPEECDVPPTSFMNALPCGIFIHPILVNDVSYYRTTFYYKRLFWERDEQSGVLYTDNEIIAIIGNPKESSVPTLVTLYHAARLTKTLKNFYRANMELATSLMTIKYPRLSIPKFAASTVTKLSITETALEIENH